MGRQGCGRDENAFQNSSNELDVLDQSVRPEWVICAARCYLRAEIVLQRGKKISISSHKCGPGTIPGP
jgi:hypothetical protein